MATQPQTVTQTQNGNGARNIWDEINLAVGKPLCEPLYCVGDIINGEPILDAIWVEDDLTWWYSTATNVFAEYDIITAPAATQQKKPLFSHYKLSDGLKWPPVDYLVEGAIGNKDIGMIFGDSGAGKTYLAIDLAVSMAAGLPWMGKWKVEKPRKVLYFISEGQRKFFSRVEAAVNGMGERGHDVKEVFRLVDENLIICTEVPQLFEKNSDRHAKKYLEFWQQIGSPTIDFIFIDTLHRASVGAEENSSKDAGVVVDVITWLQNQIDCAACFVHHSNKSGGYRGSTAYRGAVDFCFKVEGVHREPRTLIIDKLKDEEPNGPTDGAKYVALFKSDWTSCSTYTTWPDNATANATAKQSPRDEAMEQIRIALANGVELSKNKLAKKVDTVTENTAKVYIEEMIKAGEIVTRSGPNNSQLCSLAQI